MLCLELRAPFAAFRTMTAGSFRPTAAFITPSSAYGLLLNVAGVEMRYDDGKQPTTLIRDRLPVFRVALGAVPGQTTRFPGQHTVYQQLHNYPVGATGKEHALQTKGSKYNISPVRRALLTDIHAYLAMEGNEPLEQEVLRGLAGEGAPRYGLPFLGDNSFLLDRLEPVEDTQPAYWFECIGEDVDVRLRNHTTRLTIRIDRYDMSHTQSALFAPIAVPDSDIPSNAWVEVGYP